MIKAKAISSYGSGRLPEAAWKRLYEARVIRGTTQKQAAVLCGVIQQTFSGWEKLKHRPERRHRILLAAFMNVEESSLNAEVTILFRADIK